MQLLLLGTQGCHLCDEAEAIVRSYLLNKSRLIDLEIVEIAEQVHWQEHYAVHIPVLYDLETKKDLFWPFEKKDVNRFVEELGSA